MIERHSSNENGATSPLSKWRKRSFIALGITFAALTVVIFNYACFWRSWIELLNGATWPTDWQTLYEQHTLAFSVAMALRILLNLSVVPVIIWVGIEYFVLSGRRVMKLHELLALRERAVLRAMSHSLGLDEDKETQAALAATAAARNWDEHNLPAIVGPDVAKQLRESDVYTVLSDSTETRNTPRGF